MKANFDYYFFYGDKCEFLADSLEILGTMDLLKLEA